MNSSTGLYYLFWWWSCRK